MCARIIEYPFKPGFSISSRTAAKLIGIRQAGCGASMSTPIIWSVFRKTFPLSSHSGM